jgi:hypothetical protein
MAQFKDNDKLDMAGNWTFNRRVNVDANWTFPPGPFVETYKMQIVDAGPGSHGGRKFKGKFVDPAPPGLEITGENVYGQRGVQLVHMLGVKKDEQYLWVLCGKHVHDPTDRRKIWILGAGFDVGPGTGSPTGGSGNPHVFEMIKSK